MFLHVLFPPFLFAVTTFLMTANCDDQRPTIAAFAPPRRVQRTAASGGGGFFDMNGDDSAKYRNGLSSMFSFQHTARQPAAGPRHVRQQQLQQQPTKMDGVGFSRPASGGAAGANGAAADLGNIYWMSPADPNSPADMQAAWTAAGGASGATAAATAPGAMPSSQATGAPVHPFMASSPISAVATNAYGDFQQTQSLSAQPPSPPAAAQPPQQSVAMALPQQPQQQQPMSMMPMQYQQQQQTGGAAYGYGGQQGYSIGGGGGAGGGGYGSAGGGQMPMSPYSTYLEKQINTYPIMIYTLSECIPCQRAKHLLAVHYPDVRAHYLDLSGTEAWQQQLQIDLQYLTGAITFPYIFVCGQYIGGATELFELHESGQLRRMVAQCLKAAPPK